MIYQYYLFEKDGYHYNFETGKLRKSNHEPISLGLMYTCTTVTAEMHSLAFKLNTIIFSTVYSETERIKAGRFDQLLAKLSETKLLMFEQAYESCNTLKWTLSWRAKIEVF